MDRTQEIFFLNGWYLVKVNDTSEFFKVLGNLKVVTDNWQSISYFSRVLEVPLTATLELRKRF